MAETVAAAAAPATASVTAVSAKLSGLSKYVEGLGAKLQDALPKNTVLWVLLVVALIGIVALSRLMSLQKSVTELQARPLVDEYMVRKEVRTQLEETVKAIEQQNKIQMQLRQEQAIQEARRQAAEAHARAQAAAQEEAVRAAQAQAAKEQEAAKSAELERVAESARVAEPELAQVVVVEESPAEPEPATVAPQPSTPPPAADTVPHTPPVKKKKVKKAAEDVQI